MKPFKVFSIILILALLLVLLIPLVFIFAPAGIQSAIARSLAPQADEISTDFQSLRLRPGYLEINGLSAHSGQQRIEWETLRIDAPLFALVRALINGGAMNIDRIALSQVDLYLVPDYPQDPPQKSEEPFTFDSLIPGFANLRIGEFSASGNIYINDVPTIVWQTQFIDLSTTSAGTGEFQIDYKEDYRSLSIYGPITYQFSNQRLTKVVVSPDFNLQESDDTRVEINGVQFTLDGDPQQLTVSFSQRQSQTEASFSLPSLNNLPDDFPQKLFIEGMLSTQLYGKNATTSPFNISITSDQNHRFDIQSSQNLVVQFDDDASPHWLWPEGDLLTLKWESFVVPLPDWPTRIQGSIQVSQQNEQLRIHTRQPLLITPLLSQAELNFGKMNLHLDLHTDQYFKPLRLQSSLNAKIINPYTDDPLEVALATRLLPQRNGELAFEVKLTERAQRYPLIEVNGHFDEPMEQLSAALVIDLKDLDRFHILADQDSPLKNILHRADIHMTLTPNVFVSVKAQTSLDIIGQDAYLPIAVNTEFKASLLEHHYQIQQASMHVIHGDTQIARAEWDALIDKQQIANSTTHGNLQLEHDAFDLLKEYLPGLSRHYHNLNLNFDWEDSAGNLSLHLNPINQPAPAPSASFATNFHYNVNAFAAESEVFRANSRIRLSDHDTDLQIRYLAGSHSDALNIGIGTLVLDPLLEIQERLLETTADTSPPLDRPDSVPATASSSERPTTPFWKTYIRADVRSLKIFLTLEEARLNNQNAIRNLNAELTLHPDRITLDPFHFEFVDAPSRIKGELKFQPENEQRYHLDISLHSSDLESRKLARLSGPGSEHYLETRMNLSATLNSYGNSAEDLFANASSNYSLRTGPGVIRLIDPDQEDPTRDLAVAAGRILLDMIAPRYNVIPALYERMKDTPFDRFEIDASSEQPGFINVTNIEMLSPELRLNGSGRLLIDFSKTIDQSPLNLRLSLGAKQRMGELLESAGVLRGTPDPDGYRQAMREFNIRGTLGRPDTADLWRMIINRR